MPAGLAKMSHLSGQTGHGGSEEAGSKRCDGIWGEQEAYCSRAEYEDECLCPISNACSNHGRVVTENWPA